jgi:hypothetical protein
MKSLSQIDIAIADIKPNAFIRLNVHSGIFFLCARRLTKTDWARAFSEWINGHFHRQEALTGSWLKGKNLMPKAYLMVLRQRMINGNV